MAEPQIRIVGPGQDAGLPAQGAITQGAKPWLQLFLDHYGLFEQPFGVTPDPRFLYLGPRHREALAALEFGTEARRGFMALIAQPGMGKTSLLFKYLENLRGRGRTVFLSQAAGNSTDLLRQVLGDLGLDTDGKDSQEMHTILNRVLMEEMRKDHPVVLVLDEAQNLGAELLEFIRMLSNFETPWTKLLQIVLSGQPELARRLSNPSLAQLRQRISFFIPIEPFTHEQVNAFVDHRLWVAGYKGPNLFSPGARQLLAESSEGVPRTINNLSFQAMVLGWALKRTPISRDMIREVLNGLDLAALEEEARHSTASAGAMSPADVRLALGKKNGSGLRRWWPRLALAALVLFAMGWFAHHLDKSLIRGYFSRLSAFVGRGLAAPAKLQGNLGVSTRATGSSAVPESPPESVPVEVSPETSSDAGPRLPTGGVTPQPDGPLQPR